jgi:hypothetical protein
MAGLFGPLMVLIFCLSQAFRDVYFADIFQDVDRLVGPVTSEHFTHNQCPAPEKAMPARHQTAHLTRTSISRSLFGGAVNQPRSP